MSNYAIGRDLQELRSRVETLEGAWGQDRESTMRGKGRMERHGSVLGVELQKTPKLWNLERSMAALPFLNARLGLSPELKLDSAQSKTWTCNPEPLILNVTWASGGTDEFYRLQNQSFTLFRATDPNTGLATCTASYDATLIASGKAASPNSILGKLYFDIILINSAGGALHHNPDTVHWWVSCHDHYPFSATFNFNPGLYDIVAGATWQISGQGHVDRC